MQPGKVFDEKTSDEKSSDSIVFYSPLGKKHIFIYNELTSINIVA
jgi:hypothetical protein